MGSSGDLQSGYIFMSSLWVAKNLEIGMFTPAYMQVSLLENRYRVGVTAKQVHRWANRMNRDRTDTEGTREQDRDVTTDLNR